MPSEPEATGLLALIRLHRDIALTHAVGPKAALAELSTLEDALDRYHLYQGWDRNTPETGRAARQCWWTWGVR